MPHQAFGRQESACEVDLHHAVPVGQRHLLDRGGSDWFKEFGPEKSPGPKIYSLSGRVVRPGQYEAPMGTTMRELLEMAGGVRPGHQLKFWTPGGSSDRKSTRLNSSHANISYAVFCL